jgi:hypothetical protein
MGQIHENKSAADQRMHRRVGFNQQVRLFVTRFGQTLHCPAVNVSRGGVSIHSKRPLLVGRELSLEVDTGEGRVQVASAEVAWTKPMNEPGSLPWSMGIQFVLLTEKNRDLWERLVDDLTGESRDSALPGDERQSTGGRCGQTFDRAQWILPPAPAAPEPDPVQASPDPSRLFRSRAMGLAAVLLALAFLLISFQLGRASNSQNQAVEELSSRLQDAEQEVARLQARVENLAKRTDHRLVRSSTRMEAIDDASATEMRVSGGPYFRPVAIALNSED